jgi:hypothetical protein
MVKRAAPKVQPTANPTCAAVLRLLESCVLDAEGLGVAVLPTVVGGGEVVGGLGDCDVVVGAEVVVAPMGATELVVAELLPKIAPSAGLSHDVGCSALHCY